MQPGLQRGGLEETTENDKSWVQFNSANIAGTPSERPRARREGSGMKDTEALKGPVPSLRSAWVSCR